MRRSIRGVLVALTALLFAFVSEIGTASAASITNDQINGDVTARWWQVAASGGVSFADSLTGANCAVLKADTGAPIVVVAGTQGGASGPRACTIPAGAQIVLPAINIVYGLTDPVGPWKKGVYDSIGEARLYTADWMDTAEASAMIDGKAVVPTLIRSSRFMVSGAIFGLPPDPYAAAANGYWVVVKLPAGVHTVTTHGFRPASGGWPDFLTETQYTFTVK